MSDMGDPMTPKRAIAEAEREMGVFQATLYPGAEISPIMRQLVKTMQALLEAMKSLARTHDRHD